MSRLSVSAACRRGVGRRAVGSGKGLLCNLVSMIVTGESCDSRTLPEVDEEIRKMLTAELSKARPIILLDNANEKLTLVSAPLASVLTSTSWTDRILGGTQMLTVPNTAMWMLTGNNPKLSKDIARRLIRIRIDPKVDRAWTRASFKHDPIMSWAKACRANADVEAWREFALAWWAEHGPTATYVSDLTDLCERQDLMLQARGDGSARSQQSRLGRALQSARDRVFGNLQVVVVNQDQKKRALHALQQIGVKPAPPPAAEPADDDGDAVDPWQ